HLVRHAAQFRERVANLSSKSYWDKLDGSPDCVVMFVPGDPFLIAALEQDPALFDDALNKRVLITTPTTFIALAKAISYGWRQERLAESALEIAKIEKKLPPRLRSRGGHISGLGKSLARSVR